MQPHQTDPAKHHGLEILCGCVQYSTEYRVSSPRFGPPSIWGKIGLDESLSLLRLKSHNSDLDPPSNPAQCVNPTELYTPTLSHATQQDHGRRFGAQGPRRAPDLEDQGAEGNREARLSARMGTQMPDHVGREGLLSRGRPYHVGSSSPLHLGRRAARQVSQVVRHDRLSLHERRPAHRPCLFLLQGRVHRRLGAHERAPYALAAGLPLHRPAHQGVRRQADRRGQDVWSGIRKVQRRAGSRGRTRPCPRQRS